MMTLTAGVSKTVLKSPCANIYYLGVTVVQSLHVNPFSKASSNLHSKIDCVLSLELFYLAKKV